MELHRFAGDDWRVLQERFDDFMTSLGPWTEREIRDWCAAEYGEDVSDWPVTEMALRAQFPDSNTQ